MRCLERNKRSFYYALYKSKEAVIDANNNETGEIKIVYNTPVQMYANISASVGDAQVEQFGTNLSYDKVIVTADMSCPIDENTVLCVDKDVSYTSEQNGDLLYDYVVTKVAKSLNSISIAISKVKTS